MPELLLSSEQIPEPVFSELPKELHSAEVFLPVASAGRPEPEVPVPEHMPAADGIPELPVSPELLELPERTCSENKLSRHRFLRRLPVPDHQRGIPELPSWPELPEQPVPV